MTVKRFFSHSGIYEVGWNLPTHGPQGYAYIPKHHFLFFTHFPREETEAEKFSDFIQSWHVAQ